MRKSSGIKRKLEIFSYQTTDKKGFMPTIINSVNEMNKTLEKINGKKKESQNKITVFLYNGSIFILMEKKDSLGSTKGGEIDFHE